jgi:hypothetical protein
MKFVLNPRSSMQTVYTSKREAIQVQPGESVETEDAALIFRLSGDAKFSVASESPVAPVISVPESTDALPKKSRGRPKRAKGD